MRVNPRNQAAGEAGGLMKKNVVILVAGVALVGAAVPVAVRTCDIPWN